MTTRLERERETIDAMLQVFCQGKHGSGAKLCPECQELHDYALLRLSKCRFGEQKPVCGNCPIHCYKPEMRKRIVEVMRYSGPRMLYKHPILALYHVLDSRIKAAAKG